MHGVDAGRHSDDKVAIQRDNEVVTRIGEELVAQLRLDREIEHVRRDVVEHVRLVRAEQANGDRHLSLRNSTSDMMNPKPGHPPDFTDRWKYVLACAVSPFTRYQFPSP